MNAITEPILRPQGLDLYWIPLGAGARIVRFCGATYEVVCARLQHRPRAPLYHSALIAVTVDAAYVIEMTPIPSPRSRLQRDVVAEGPVGIGWAGRLRVFRYEIRRWRNGMIPDISYAVSSPVRISDDVGVARTVLGLVPAVPTPVWGRDELHAGDMWNSNSVVAWLLASAGVEGAAGEPPNGGRAPGWGAGVVVARREAADGRERAAA